MEDKTRERLIEEIESLRREVAELRQGKSKLQETEGQYRAIFENVSDGIVQTDKYGKIININQRVEDICGYHRDEVIGKNFTEIDVFNSEDALKIEVDPIVRTG